MAERAVCVVGSGLIGGSLLRAAEKAGRTVWGASASEGTAAQACADGFDVTINTDAALRRAADSDALVVLAVPLPAVPDVLRRVDAIAPTCRLTDAVSVKVAVADAVDRYAPRARYVGGHPMAGTAESGWAAGDAELFTGAAWVVAADDGLDLDVWRDVAELAWACGARVVPAAADEHDLAVARVSHLPHLLAAVLAAVGAGRPGDDLPLALAASSFADGTRVAGTRPELVLAMCEGNRDALLAAVDDALGRLGVMRGALASTGGLAATVKAGYAGRMRWSATREPLEHRVSLAGSGRAGGAARDRSAGRGRHGLGLTRSLRSDERGRAPGQGVAAAGPRHPRGDPRIAEHHALGVHDELRGERVPRELHRGLARPLALAQRRERAVALLDDLHRQVGQRHERHGQHVVAGVAVQAEPADRQGVEHRGEREVDVHGPLEVRTGRCPTRCR